MARAVRHFPRLSPRDLDLLAEIANDNTLKAACAAIGVSESRGYNMMQGIKVELDCVTYPTALVRAVALGFIVRDGDGIRDPWRPRS